MELTDNTTLKQINDCPAFSQAKGHLIAGWKKEFENERTLEDLQRQYPTWNSDDIIFGLNNLRRISETEKQYLFYPDEHNRNVCLFYLPSENRIHHEYFMLLAGGAYGSVCTMIETLPVAARLNELGFDVFCVNYTVADQSSFEEGLMPRPLKDVSDCWKWIRKNEDRFKVKAEDFFLGGFSAGGHLAGCYALSRIGAERYGAANPKGLLLVYPLISLESINNERIKEYMKLGLFGSRNRNDPSDYEIHLNITESYPKTFYVHCLDDDTIPENNPLLMKEALEKNNVVCFFDTYEKGGHGFGLGSRNPGSTYLDKAVEFLLKEDSHET